MFHRFCFFLLTAFLFSQTTWGDSAFLCRAALNNFEANFAIEEINQRNNQMLFPSTTSLTAYKQSKLSQYLAKLDIRDLVIQHQSAHIAENILRIIEGDKFSVLQKWSMETETYRWTKQKQIVREFILKNGLNDIFAEIGFKSPSFRSRLKLRVHSILRNTGLLWLFARINLSAITYNEIPEELSSAIILDGWDAHRDEINLFFSQQSKRHLYNTWHKELGLILGGILAFTTYFSVYDQSLLHFQQTEQAQVYQVHEFEQSLQAQRNQVNKLSDQEQELFQQLDEAVHQQLNDQSTPTDLASQATKDKTREQLRELFVNEESSP